jgi:hypothetical protein
MTAPDEVIRGFPGHGAGRGSLTRINSLSRLTWSIRSLPNAFLIDNTAMQLLLRFLTASMAVLPRVASTFSSRGFGMIDSAVHRAGQ